MDPNETWSHNISFCQNLPWFDLEDEQDSSKRRFLVSSSSSLSSSDLLLTTTRGRMAISRWVRACPRAAFVCFDIFILGMRAVVRLARSLSPLMLALSSLPRYRAVSSLSSLLARSVPDTLIHLING